MSRKIQQFVSVITNPMNTHNFALGIPGFEAYSLVVQSTSFPTESLRQVRLYIQGEEVRYPTIPSNQGTWQFSVPETDSGEIGATLERIKARMWNQRSGAFTADPSLWRDVTVTARDLNSNESFQVILHGAWLQGRSDVQLSQQNPEANWNWQYQWVYQWIEDKNLRGF